MTGMVTKVELDKAGDKVRVFHLNPRNMSWTHPYDQKAQCLVCQGKSTAAPEDKSG